MPLATEDEQGAANLLGMPGNLNNPGRRNQGSMKAAMNGDGSIGDMAFRDGVLIVIFAWVLLFLIAFSLRRHNV